MKFIQEFFEGCRVSGIYLCKHKQAAVTKNGKPYENVILQDKTGTIDAKIWDPNSLGIDDFETLDYIEIMGDVTNFAGALQLNIKRARKAREGEYDPTDYLPVSKCDRHIGRKWKCSLRWKRICCKRYCGGRCSGYPWSGRFLHCRIFKQSTGR